MAWKKKERTVSKEELIEAAQQELKPYWFGSKPLISGVKQPTNPGEPEKFSAIPLDPSFLEKSWLMIFADSTEFMSTTALEAFGEWYRRYKVYDLSFMVVLRMSYKFMLHPAQIATLTKNHGLPSPIVQDHDGNLSKAFGAENMPKVVFFDKGKILWERSGSNWGGDLEKQIQSFLRMSDPGLPLLPPQSVSSGVGSLLRLDFGKGKGAKLVKGPPELGTEFGTVYFEGNWSQDEDSIFTSDRDAVLRFNLGEAKRLAVIAESRAKSFEQAAIVIELEGATLYDTIMGEDMVSGDVGSGIVRVERPAIFDILNGLDGKSADLVMRFPTAKLKPIAIFGLRLG